MAKKSKKEAPVLTEAQKENILKQLKPENKIKKILETKTPSLVRRRVGRPDKYSLEFIKKCMDEYLASCWEPERNMFGDAITNEFGEIVWRQNKPYTLEGFDAWVGWDRIVRLEYEKKPEFTNTIKKLREIVYGFAVESLWKPNATGVIFNLKNNWGWVDKIVNENTNISVGDVLETQEDEGEIEL